MTHDSGFFNLYRHGFARVALATPLVRIGDPMANAAATLALVQAATRKAVVAVFPELGLSAYSCEDLFHQQALLEGLARRRSPGCSRARRACRSPPSSACRWWWTACSTTAPRSSAAASCSAWCPRPTCPTTASSTSCASSRRPRGRSGDRSAGQNACRSEPLIFRLKENPRLRLFAEICEDLWVPAPPSSFAALAGATVIANLSASNVLVGKDQYRKELAGNQSARCIAAYLYSAAGAGESTTDLAWDGHALAYENGSLLAESRRYAREPQLTFADIDLERLEADRMRQNSFGESARRHADRSCGFQGDGFFAPAAGRKNRS